MGVSSLPSNLQNYGGGVIRCSELSSNRARSITQTCARSWNLTCSDTGRSKSLAGSGGSCKLAVICQVVRDNAFSALLNQNCQLKFNMLSHWQPVKLPQDSCDVLTQSSATTTRNAKAFFYRQRKLSEMPNDSELQQFRHKEMKVWAKSNSLSMCYNAIKLHAYLFRYMTK